MNLQSFKEFTNYYKRSLTDPSVAAVAIASPVGKNLIEFSSELNSLILVTHLPDLMSQIQAQQSLPYKNNILDFIHFV